MAKISSIYKVLSIFLRAKEAWSARVLNCGKDGSSTFTECIFCEQFAMPLIAALFSRINALRDNCGETG
ncbi:hypothetical protein [Agrobacterium vitis]|uniref:hypothetical protein n=1 Tax=Agrobacterium vitis TaxID=373 RepID=UPI0015D96D81|nr:hypothetical protein [Agrobacterium vitis]